jgi:hypothetical protein
MAKAAYVGVDGTARQARKIYVGVDGAAREAVKGYVGVDGVARQFYENGDAGLKPIEFTVTGTTLMLKVNGDAGAATGLPFQWSKDHGATWTNRNWLNANINFTGLSNHTLMLRGDLRTTDGNPGGCAFYLKATTTLIGASGSFASILGGADGSIVATAPYMFFSMFENCGKLASIGADLFRNIVGPPRENMFPACFYNCNDLAALPAGLFSGIAGPAAVGCFSGCFGADSPGTGLTSIPDKLFAGLTGPAANWMLNQAFLNRSLLTGPSASTNSGKLYTRFPNATVTQVGSCYAGCTGLSDYASIPDNWK